MASLRLGIVINPDIDEALKRVSERTRIPVSTLVRDAIIAMLESHGETIDAEIKPGGNRREVTHGGEAATTNGKRSKDK